MHLNIAHKIFGIAVVVLILMAAVAIYSIQLTEKISDELDNVAGRQLPLTDNIGQLNVKILEQGLLLQRLFALPEETPRAVARIKILGEDINAEFEEAKLLFKQEENAEYPPESIFALERSLLKVEDEFRKFEEHSFALLALHESHNTTDFYALLPDLNRQQNAIDEEIANLHLHMEDVTQEAVDRADKSEKLLLYFNAALTSLAAVLGLGFAAYVTYVLVRNVRNLVRATKEIEDGRLDTEVAVVTKDEVGQLASSFNTMVDGLRMKERIKDTFGKYMDPRLVSNLLERPELTKLGGDRREMTVMFIDLKDYTSISEKLSPPDLVRMINVFFSQMTTAISENSGVINDFQGDAVMAYWGPPFTGSKEHAQCACHAALAAVENFEKFRAVLRAELGDHADRVNTDLRIGISSGEMLVGNIGSAETRKFSVIGDAVNLGSRLEGANKNYGTRIILGEHCRELAGDDIYVRELDLIRVKGKTQPTRIFELLREPHPTDTFEAGLAAYRAQDWDAAMQAFQKCRQETPDDPVPDVFLDRIAHLQSNPPGPDWDGVWVFQTK